MRYSCTAHKREGPSLVNGEQMEEFVARALHLLSLERAAELAKSDLSFHSSSTCLCTLAVASQKVKRCKVN